MQRWIIIALTAWAVGMGFNAHGQGLPNQAWPAGTHLSNWNHGGRIVTFHNGYLYLGATDNQHATIYDISDPQAPALMHNFQVGNNGHTWHKIGNAFWRAYWNPELGPADVPAPFADLSDMLDWQPFTGAVHDFPFVQPPLTWPGNWIGTYPYHFGDGIHDARVGWWPPVSERNLQQEAGVGGSNRWRLGNLLFFTPGDDQNGMAVFDIGDPVNPVLLDTLPGNILQYTNAWQIWRNYVVLMIGDDSNGPAGNANTLIIDISDPTNLAIAATIPYDDLPGRYTHFQDQYAFSGRFNRGVKFNMETLQVERVFTPPSGGFGDFQWIPLGHLLLVSSSESNASHSYLFTHQDGLDTTPPSVGYHLPADGAINQPVTAVIGLVINEVLDSTTVNDQTIQVSPLGGDPIAGVVLDSNYDVVNFVPVDDLMPDTTYEVRLVAGGIHDVAGNAMEEYVFHFSTGDKLGTVDPIEITAIQFTPASPTTTGSPVTASVTAAGGAGTLEYRWNFGDGSPDSGWVAELDAHTHTYTDPGTFTVQVQVRDGNNQTAARTARLVVHPPFGAQRPTHSGSIVVDEAGRQVWLVNPDHGSVARLDADLMSLDFATEACANPRNIALDAQQRPWVTCRDGGLLARLDPATGAVTHTLDSGRGTAPEGLVFAPDGQTGYASLSGSGQVLRFDAAGGIETGRLDVGPHPHALAVTAGHDRLLVSRLIATDDTASEIFSIALPSFSAATTVALPLDATSPDSGTAGRGLPNYVAALALAPDDSRLWYTAKKDNILRGQWHENTDLTFETLVRTLLGSVDVAAGSELLPARMDLDDSSLALALTGSPGGAHVFVALAGNHRVIAVDPWQGQEIQRLDVGFTPRGLAVDAVTGRLFVRQDLDRSVAVVDAAALMASGTDSMSVITEIATSGAEVLPPAVLAGKRLFFDAADTRMGQDGYMACASCHLDGRGDGRVWDFTQQGEGLRLTIPLHGRAGLAHGFLHWSANFDEAQDFEIQIRNLFAGTGYIPDAEFHTDPLGPALAGLSPELDNLAAYLASLDRFGHSPYRNADGSLTADAVAGRDHFLALGCAGCHGGSDFTDSAAGLMHDVGTLAIWSGRRLGGPLLGLDTPTLRGLWNSAPYLHDGRAADLQAVLTDANPDDRHGAVSALTAGELDQLVAYLLQIDDDEPPAPVAMGGLNWLEPAHGEVFDENSSITLAVDASLPAIISVEFLANGVPVSTLTAPPWTTQWTGSAGEVWLQARVGHGDGMRSLTRPVRVNFGLCSGDAGVKYEKWDGISGTAISALTGHPDYPDHPDHVSHMTDLVEAPTDIDDNYGARLSGWLCVPDSGEYTLWIASDDSGSLRLSTDAEPDNIQEIAFHTGWTQPREWSKYPTQQSAAVWLDAGRYYYLEALMKEAAGGDNLAVGWRLPDGSLQRPMPASVILRAPGGGVIDLDTLFRDRFQP